MDSKTSGQPQSMPRDHEQVGSGRDPEERPAQHHDEVRQKNLDKTLADSFPTSDPPSSIPDPAAAHAPNQSQAAFDTLIAALPSGSWAVISEDQLRVIGTGPTRDEAIQSAGSDFSEGMRIVRVPQDPDAPEQAA